ncbi:MAG: hypothetical protein ACRDSJ_25595 [Rubrobacteraceae bacterium]
MERLPEFDIRCEGHGWSGEEIERKRRHPMMPEDMELIDGRMFGADEYRLVALGFLLENVGADAAVRLGEPEVWREAIRALPDEPE